MKFVGDLLSLRCSFAGGRRVFSSAVAAYHFNFRVGKQPGFDSLLPAVWQNLDRAPELEINQERAVDLPLFPCPIINSQDPYRGGGSTGDGTQSTQEAGSPNLQ